MLPFSNVQPPEHAEAATEFGPFGVESENDKSAAAFYELQSGLSGNSKVLLVAQGRAAVLPGAVVSKLGWPLFWMSRALSDGEMVSILDRNGDVGRRQLAGFNSPVKPAALYSIRKLLAAEGDVHALVLDRNRSPELISINGAARKLLTRIVDNWVAGKPAKIVFTPNGPIDRDVFAEVAGKSRAEIDKIFDIVAATGGDATPTTALAIRLRDSTSELNFAAPGRFAGLGR